jgi:hypothetical protein
MNNETLVNDIINSLVSMIADAAVTRIEEKLNAIIDEKFGQTALDNLQNSLFESRKFKEAVGSAVGDMMSDIVSEVEGNIDFGTLISDEVSNLEFDIRVR